MPRVPKIQDGMQAAALTLINLLNVVLFEKVLDELAFMFFHRLPVWIRGCFEGLCCHRRVLPPNRWDRRLL